MPMVIDVASLIGRKTRLPVVAATARSSVVMMDGHFSFEVKDDRGQTLSMGKANPYTFLPPAIRFATAWWLTRKWTTAR
jgi:hypothetical protein